VVARKKRRLTLFFEIFISPGGVGVKNFAEKKMMDTDKMEKKNDGHAIVRPLLYKILNKYKMEVSWLGYWQ